MHTSTLWRLPQFVLMTHTATFTHPSATVQCDTPPPNPLPQSALHWASKEGHRRCIEILLDAGANINAIDEVGPHILTV